MTKIENLSRSLGIADQIKWDLRFIPEAEVAELFRSASLVALPYLRIDQSGVLMTAIGFEKPIVAIPDWRHSGRFRTVSTGPWPIRAT